MRPGEMQVIRAGTLSACNGAASTSMRKGRDETCNCSRRGLGAAPARIEQANVALEPPTPVTTPTGRSGTHHPRAIDLNRH